MNAVPLRYDAPRLRVSWTVGQAQLMWQSLDAVDLSDPEVHLLKQELEIDGTAKWGRGWWLAVL